MVTCQVCNEHVGYTFLRAERPKCPNDHELGTWVHCQNEKEPHVFLRRPEDGKCPYCANTDFITMKEGLKVKCLHVTNEGGLPCIARPYLWIKEGPPCFMNHIARMIVYEAPPKSA